MFLCTTTEEHNIRARRRQPRANVDYGMRRGRRPPTTTPISRWIGRTLARPAADVRYSALCG